LCDVGVITSPPHSSVCSSSSSLSLPHYSKATPSLALTSPHVTSQQALEADRKPGLMDTMDGVPPRTFMMQVMNINEVMNMHDFDHRRSMKGKSTKQRHK